MLFAIFRWRHARQAFKKPVECRLTVKARLQEDIQNGLVRMGRIGQQLLGLLNPVGVDEFKEVGTEMLVDDRGDIFNRVIDQDRKSTRLNSSHVAISYAVFCLKKKN